MKMRIAIFTTHPIQYQAPWFQALAQQPDMDVHVFFSYVPTAGQQGAGFGAAFHWDLDLRSGYPSTVLATSPERPLPEFFKRPVKGLGAALSKMRPDVALIMGWQEISLVQAYLACRPRGIPIILRGESNVKRDRSQFVATLQRSYVSGAASALAIGDSNAQFFRQAGMAGRKVFLARYFVDNRRFSEAAESLRGQRSQLRQQWNIPEEAFCFLFAGKIEPKKRPLDFLEAIRRAAAGSKRVHGLVVGSGEFMDAARSLVQEHRLPVTFAGFLNQTDLPRAYIASDALVLPSDYGETWGLVVNEAMATGLPAIVSDRVGCADDLVRQGETGAIFPFGDTSALAEILLEWEANRDMPAALGSRARERVHAHYNIDAAVTGLRMAAQFTLGARSKGR